MQNSNLSQSLRLLRTPRFGTFWFASLLSSIGTWAQQVAQPWLLLNLGASSFLLGLDTFAMGAPGLLLTLVGGALADRADRRHVIAFFQSIQMLCPTLLVVLLLLGAVHPWIVISLSLVVGVTDALSMPSFQTIVPLIVEREQIATGIALNSTQFNLSRIAGPALAGVLMASMGAVGAFALSAASYLPFILVALWILPRPGAAGANNVSGANGATSVNGSMGANGVMDPNSAGGANGARLDIRLLSSSVREIAAVRALRGGLLTVLATSLLCAPLITFCPVLVKQNFHGDVGHFSVIVGSFGLGGLLGAVGLLSIAPARDRRPIGSWMAGSFAIIVVLTALSSSFWALLVLFICAGAAMTTSNTSANAFLLSAAPVRLRGQAISLYMLAMRGGAAAGSLLTGLSINQFGIRVALLINGLAAILAQVSIARSWLAGSASGFSKIVSTRK